MLNVKIFKKFLQFNLLLYTKRTEFAIEGHWGVFKESTDIHTAWQQPPFLVVFLKGATQRESYRITKGCLEDSGDLFLS